jgi:hypothetical protein
VTRYFKRAAESELGAGTVWIEFSAEIATRQIERYGDRWFTADDPLSYHDEIGPGLIDQSLSSLELETSEEITEEDFENSWRLARKYINNP